MLSDSLLSGDNAAWLDAQYQQWLMDPSSVDAELRAAFESYERVAPLNGTLPGQRPHFEPRSIFDPVGLAGANEVSTEAAVRQAKVVQLINAYRVRAHLAAQIDPLGRREIQEHPELFMDFHGLRPEELDAEVSTQPLYGLPKTASLRTILEHCRAAYCGSIGAEFMNIMDNEQKHWVQQQLETLPGRGVLNPQEEARVYRKLCDAENFERLLHTRFPGTKRFSLEGAETLVPLLDLVVEHAAQRGVKEIVFGMAHRGRLNTLVNILEKPVKHVIDEFQDVGGTTQGSGDVKYHLGYSADTVTVHGDRVHLSLTPNPSHLEAVNPIVEGRVRAKQDRSNDDERRGTMALLIHGDAAFSGQGLVMECLNLSELEGYRTGGTIHVIVNNQIGFTTPPNESRSTPYATDIARMLAVPIFHVNGEDPRAVAAVVQMAVEYRQRFQRDVVIDMYCYRKHGHNEGDEPSFTQPQMYEVIRSKPTPREVYRQHLLRIGALSDAELSGIETQSQREMALAADMKGEMPSGQRPNALEQKVGDPDLDRYFATDEAPKNAAGSRQNADAQSPLKGLWARYSGGDIRDEVDTGVPLETLRSVLQEAHTLPDGFTPHTKIKRLFAQRDKMIRGEAPIDWALGEQAAWGTLLTAGVPVRLSGQDCGRGTFSHRHAVVTDPKTGQEVYPLQRLGWFHAIDSSLSEAGVLGFEVGYALDTPDGLVMWEAQFGDFANGAQIIIDQYLTASEQKWGRFLGLVMLLPHGYEGQGPEHSSGRMERFLLQCGQDNIQVANVTTPAQLFHLMRRQVIRRVRKPLVLFTPKSLLRHPEATSTLEELATGAFHNVIPETDGLVDDEVDRLVLCTGKLYYELRSERRKREDSRTAIARMEMIHPYPQAEIEALLARYPKAQVVWCQEEPKNMGAWPVLLHWMLDHFPAERLPTYVGRPAAAAPATGSNKKHRQEQAALIDAALSR